MAEFSEVMRQLNRLCSRFQDCCERGCPMFDECGNIGAHCSEPKHSYRIEKTVMSWAAEHPEPRYPTWERWLVSQGIIYIPDAGQGRAWMIDGETAAIIREKGEKPIPADIAEKLGIQPEEG